MRRHYVMACIISSWMCAETAERPCELHCVKSVRIRSYSGPHFPSFGLNTERYGFEVSKPRRKLFTVKGHRSLIIWKFFHCSPDRSSMQWASFKNVFIRCFTFFTRWQNCLETLLELFVCSGIYLFAVRTKILYDWFFLHHNTRLVKDSSFAECYLNFN